MATKIETRISMLAQVVEPEHRDTLAQALKAGRGSLSEASAKLKDTLPPETMQRLSIADLVCTAVGDQPHVLDAVGKQSDIQTVRHLANLGVAELAKRLAPDAVEGSDAHRQALEQAHAINCQSFVREPVTVLQRMGRDGDFGEEDDKLGASFSAFLHRLDPGLELRKTPVHKVLTDEALKDVPVEHREEVKERAKTLWRTVDVAPTDAPHAITALMKKNLTSAFHIAERPESQFLNLIGPEIGESVARQVYTRAVNTRIRNEHALINLREAVRGTGLAAIDGTQRLEERKALLNEIAEANGTPLNLDALFGDMDHCECKECQSVYSASAYFVELLEFLRSYNLGKKPSSQKDPTGISGTPLAKLFQRRPDLRFLELSCENTNTLIPYIDLVNEVMETYIVQRIAHSRIQELAYELYRKRTQGGADYEDDDWYEAETIMLDGKHWQDVTSRAYNVIDETSQELLAQPQHTNDAAYCFLKNTAVFPFTLPFNLPIEAQRLYLKFLGTSRHELLDVFRKATGPEIDLRAFPGVAPGNPLTMVRHDAGRWPEVQRRAIDAEYLGLTLEEYVILTKEAFWPIDYFFPNQTEADQANYRHYIGVREPWEYYGYADAQLMDDTNPNRETGCNGLSFVKWQFLPRTGLSLTELIDLLKTRYVNPQYRLCVEDSTVLEREIAEHKIVRSYVDQNVGSQLGKLIVLSAGDGLLPFAGLMMIRAMDISQASQYWPIGVLFEDGTVLLFGELAGYVQADGLVMLAADQPIFPIIREKYPGASAVEIWNDGERVGFISLDSLLCGADEMPVKPKQESCNLDVMRIRHLDRSAVTHSEFDRMQRFIRLWRKLGWSMDEVDAALHALGSCQNEDSGPTSNDVDITPDFLHQLVAVKKLMDITGLPVTKLLSFWGDVPVMAGNVAAESGSPTVAGKLRPGIDPKSSEPGTMISPAFRDGLPAMIAATGLRSSDIERILGLLKGQYSFDWAAAAYRYGLLAKTLGLRVADLPYLKAVLDQEPFANAVATLNAVTALQKVTDGGFTLRQLAYVTADLDDPLKPLAPSQKDVLSLGKTLYDGLSAIERDNRDLQAVDPADPVAVDSYLLATAEIVRAKAGTIFEAAAVERIVGFLEGTASYTTYAPPGLTINASAGLVGRVKYSGDIGRLSVVGIVKSDGLLAMNTSADPEWVSAIERIERQYRLILERDELSDIVPVGALNEFLEPDTEQSAGRKRYLFLKYFLPFLRTKLAHRFIVSTLAESECLPADVTDTILTDVLIDSTSGKHALDVLRGISGNPVGTAVSPAAAWYLIPPQDDDRYCFGTSGGHASIVLDGVSLAFGERDDVTGFRCLPSPLSLSKGRLHRLDGVDSPSEQLLWRMTGTSWAPIPSTALLPDHFSDATAGVIKTTLVALRKLAIVVNGLGLSADEIRFFTSHPDDLSDDNDTFDWARLTFHSWQRLADYVALRKSMPTACMPLLDFLVWRFDKSATITELPGQLNRVTQWGTSRIGDLLLDADGLSLQDPQKVSIDVLVASQRAIAVADKLGADVATLFKWATPCGTMSDRRMNPILAGKTTIVPGPDYWTSRQYADAMLNLARARFDGGNWDENIKPVSDRLRKMQRQALTDYLVGQRRLGNWRIDDADSLFEYFLIDVQMGTERETSRMVQAIASVQLFIKRCLMGLEEGVDKGTIDPDDRWQWMQQYRVWEANRKVFLYPENWIRPELRDDKSQFYKELESELLQKDINSETVAEAIRNYIYKVDEVANLKVVGLFHDQPTGRLHVFARSRSAPFSFWYRYFDCGVCEWYPWEKMQVDIPSYDIEDVDASGNPTGRAFENGTYLIPVVWNNRLLAFFPQFMKKTSGSKSTGKIADMGASDVGSLKPPEQWEIKMGWSEYRHGRWTQKLLSTDAIYNPIVSGAESARISSYMFFPSVTPGGAGVAIDVYYRSIAPSRPIYLKAAKIKFEQAIPAPLLAGTKFTAQVFSLITGNVLTNETEVVVAIPYLPNDLELKRQDILRDECRSFMVKVTIPVTLVNVKEYRATVELSFSDPAIASVSATRMVKADKSSAPLTWLFHPDEITLAHIEPAGPTLRSVEIEFDNKGDGKNEGSSFDVAIYDLNGGRLEKGPNSLKDITDEYLKDSQKTVPLKPVTGLTKAQCQRFAARISNFKKDGGHVRDDWQFVPTVRLKFQDDAGPITSFTATNDTVAFSDTNNEAEFYSEDTFWPDAIAPQADPEQSHVEVVNRFEFSGNAVTLSAPDWQPHVRGYEFHYLSKDGNRVIHSLQVEGSRPILIDSAPYFEDVSSNLWPSGQQYYALRFPGINQALGKLTAGGALDRLYDYSSNLDSEDAGEAFGGLADDEGRQSYHELMRPFSLYAWEVCFHAPMQLVEHLLKSRQFEQALDVCHYVFNPLAAPIGNEDVTSSCWRFPPFKDINARNVLETLFEGLRPGEPNEDITDWRNHPFEPHRIARRRPSAYMKYVVAKYIEILIEYGDYYYRQYTQESIPLAIQCYVMASHLYGPPGQKIPRRNKASAETYNSLLGKLDAFGNAMKDWESVFPIIDQVSASVGGGDVPPGIFGTVRSLYFCIPDNPNLTALRTRIDDRLRQIRSCQNIEGVFQQAPLFAPEIDPALLVQAAAQGLSLQDVLNDLNSPMPNYRFYYLLQEALEMCSEVKAMGNAFLAAKEKGDAETLAAMRAGHEAKMQVEVMTVRKQQLDEAQKSLEALQQSRKGVESRMKYYLKLFGEEVGKVPDESAEFSEIANQLPALVDESGLKLLPYEKEEMGKAEEAAQWQIAIGILETNAGVLHALPNTNVHGTPLGVGTVIKWGPGNIAGSIQALSRAFQTHASHLSHQSSSASRKAGFLRQLQERIQQANAAGYELKNIDRQILTQKVRLLIAQQEISNQQKQIDNAAAVEEYLRSKYTNAELYSWMEGEIRSLHHQAYTLAFDLAKKAERAYQFERGATSSAFIQYGYWNAGRDGLLSGERLYLGLKQLETAYQENRGYDYEITKHVSLRQTDPEALAKLQVQGKCDFAIPEVLFDLDHPGHYMRRIKSVALTVPCVVGPYVSLNCTLRLTEHRFRLKPTIGSGYQERTDETDDRFATVNVPISAIAVSSGQNDNGVFELNFRDERYLPFEGAGAVSKWHLELPPNDLSQFDYGTISDVVLHLRYTSREGGDQLKDRAEEVAWNFVAGGLPVYFEVKRDFPTEYQKAISTGQSIVLQDLKKRMPYCPTSDGMELELVRFKVLRETESGGLQEVAAVGDLDSGGLELDTDDIRDSDRIRLIVWYARSVAQAPGRSLGG